MVDGVGSATRIYTPAESETGRQFRGLLAAPETCPMNTTGLQGMHQAVTNSTTGRAQHSLQYLQENGWRLTPARREVAACIGCQIMSALRSGEEPGFIPKRIVSCTGLTMTGTEEHVKRLKRLQFVAPIESKQHNCGGYMNKVNMVAPGPIGEGWVAAIMRDGEQGLLPCLKDQPKEEEPL